jgi:hypothetical protein
MGRVLLSMALGFFALVVFIGVGELLGVPGQNTIKEILGASLGVTLYLAISQFFVAPRGSSKLGPKWPTMVAMGAPLLVVLSWTKSFPGYRWEWAYTIGPVLVSGCVGILAGAWAAGRVALSALSLESCRRNLRACATLLAAVAVVLAAAVIPLTRKAGTFPDGAPGGMVPVFSSPRVSPSSPLERGAAVVPRSSFLAFWRSSRSYRRVSSRSRRSGFWGMAPCCAPLASSRPCARQPNSSSRRSPARRRSAFRARDRPDQRVLIPSNRRRHDSRGTSSRHPAKGGRSTPRILRSWEVSSSERAGRGNVGPLTETLRAQAHRRLRTGIVVKFVFLALWVYSWRALLR